MRTGCKLLEYQFQKIGKTLSYGALVTATKSLMKDKTEIRETLASLHVASFGWAMVCCRGSYELAEEVLQTVYLKVLGGGAKFGGNSSFQTWLFAVIRNTARDHLRGRWWSRVLKFDFVTLAGLAEATDTSESQLDHCEEAAAVRAALERLPERQRQVAHLVFYQDLSIAQAAQIMGVHLGTARQHYSRAKAMLRQILKPQKDQADELAKR